MTRRGLKAPEFLIVDGALGLEAAFAALWLDVPVQRCTVHKYCNVIFERFVGFVNERREQYPDLLVYHYAPYQPSALKRLMRRYATREGEIDNFLRSNLLVDLYSVVRNGLRAGVESYGSTDNLVWLVLKRQILPFIPVFDKGERTDGTFSRSDFKWDDENDRYICPGGKEMRHTWRTYSDAKRNAPSWRSRKYRARSVDCRNCLMKAKCCPNSEARAIHREKYEIVRDFARQGTSSEFNPKAQARRKKVEMLFAQPKRILGLGRLRLRGPCGVQDEFSLAATAQNLRKLAKLKPMAPTTG